jgi:hypothetical protein
MDSIIRENYLLEYKLLNNMAGGRGLEPLLAESESAVLPLDEPPVTGQVYILI